MCKLDLGVILDESSSISPTSLFRKETDFIRDLTDHLTIGPQNTLVSVLTFSTIARMKFRFRDSDGRSKFALNNALLRINMLGMLCYLLLICSSVIFSKMRYQL